MSGFTVQSDLRAFGAKCTEANLEQEIGRLLLDKKVGEEVTALDVYRVVILLANQNIKLKEAIAEMALLQSPDLSVINSKLSDHETRLDDLSSDLDNLDSNIREAKSDLGNDIDNVAGKVSDLDSSIDNLNSEVSNLSDKLDEVSSDLYLLGPKE